MNEFFESLGRRWQKAAERLREAKAEDGEAIAAFIREVREELEREP